MRKYVVIFLLLTSSVLSIWYFWGQKTFSVVTPLTSRNVSPSEKPLEKYSFENLRKKVSNPSEISLGESIKDDAGFASRIFYFTDSGKKVSGLINIPKSEGKSPIIVMLRGYVDREIYKTGEGTRRSGEEFARNGFITLAPDFLGYGQSASPSAQALEERFQTYTTALSLLASLSNLNSALEDTKINVKADTEKIGIWGHSNGGHIALSVLAIAGKPYPTVLWAPVSKPFPYSILYFTDEFEDHGRALRKVVADFEKDYDAENYSPTNYYDWIEAPLQIHQGGADDAVPQRWSDQLVEKLEELDRNVEYFVYPDSDHNLSPDGWSLAVGRSIEFFRRNLLNI